MELDFYYSQQAFNYRREESLFKRSVGLTDGDRITRFKGQIYTECIEKNKKPVSNWPDLVYIGTGTYDDIILA